MYHKRLQSLTEIHMPQEYIESACEQRIALIKMTTQVHVKTLHTLVGLGSVAPVAAVAIHRYGNPHFVKRDQQSV